MRIVSLLVKWKFGKNIKKSQNIMKMILGGFINDVLSWNKKSENIYSELSRAKRLISKLRRFLPTKLFTLSFIHTNSIFRCFCITQIKRILTKLAYWKIRFARIFFSLNSIAILMVYFSNSKLLKIRRFQNPTNCFDAWFEKQRHHWWPWKKLNTERQNSVLWNRLLWNISSFKEKNFKIQQCKNIKPFLLLYHFQLVKPEKI